MAKKSPRSKCLEALQKLTRLKACDDSGFCKCVTCGHTDYFTQMQGGHFIPKGNSSRWALEPENVHVQCPSCNLFQMKHGTASHAYTLYMIDFYGRDFVDQMLASKSETLKLYKRDYEEMLSEWIAQIKEHLHRVGH